MAAEDDWFRSECRRHLETVTMGDFDAFFTEIMREKHGDAYHKPAPHGNDGDLASDGYHTQEHHCFQCYSPETYRLATTRTKMSKDFARAKQEWGHMQKWTFVLNYPKTAAPLVRDLAALQATNSPLGLTIWDRDKVLDEFQSLPATCREILLGKINPLAQMEALTRYTIAAVVKRIKPDPDALDRLTNPTAGKLAHNSVDDKWRFQLKVGMAGHPAVRDFFLSQSDERVGTRTAATLHARYEILKASGLNAGECLDALYKEMFDASNAGQSQHYAVLAVLAYFFETCDILEPEI